MKKTAVGNDCFGKNLRFRGSTPLLLTELVDLMGEPD
jgi:hypothetical protein